MVFVAKGGREEKVVVLDSAPWCFLLVSDVVELDRAGGGGSPPAQPYSLMFITI